VGMTGIGMVNATETTEAALDYFTPESGVSIGAVVFSGVAGGSGRTEIGDVAVPAQWTSDGGETWHAVDADMLAAASTLDVDLLSTDSIGDPACSCGLFSRVRVDLEIENGESIRDVRFAIVSNRPEAIPESYTRYLANGFREAWRFTGSPLNLKFRRRRETARR